MFFNPGARSWSLPDYNVTPLIPLPGLAKELGLGNVFLKDEANRFGLPAFKILGASWAVHRAITARCNLPLTCSLKELGSSARTYGIRLVACTEGNWGRAVARMARYLRIPSIIFVPNFMDEATQGKISSEGAHVVVVDGDYDKSIAVARKQAGDSNSLLVMDVSWKGYEDIPQWVVEGYSTMLSESDQQLQELGINLTTHAIASVGVGSWAQAVAMHYKSKDPSIRVITVEPETAACLQASLQAGKITPITTGHTIMNGMNCGTVSYTAWPILQKGVDASIKISDIEAHQDVQYLHSLGVQNGPCGGAPLSALRRLVKEKKLGLDDQSVVVLFSTEGARDYVVPN